MREEKVIIELKGRDTCSSIQYYSVPSPLRSSDNTGMQSIHKRLTVKHQKQQRDAQKMANTLNYRKRNQLPREARGVANEMA